MIIYRFATYKISVRDLVDYVNINPDIVVIVITLTTIIVQFANRH